MTDKNKPTKEPSRPERPVPKELPKPKPKDFPQIERKIENPSKPWPRG
jgi:hypothetical protein